MIKLIKRKKIEIIDKRTNEIGYVSNDNIIEYGDQKITIKKLEEILEVKILGIIIQEDGSIDIPLKFMKRRMRIKMLKYYKKNPNNSKKSD